MATLQEQSANVRTSMGDPLPQSPSPRHVWQAIIRQAQSFYNQLNNTAVSWATAETTVDVVAGIADYLISAPAWGKCLLVSTVDASNPGHWERWVPFYEPQNLLLAYDGPRDGASWSTGFIDGSQHTALGVAFLRDSGTGLTARFRPVPEAAATYNILYTIGDWASGARLGSVPVLSEHHHLIEVKAALSCLHMAKWWVVPADADAETQAAFAKMNAGQREQVEIALLRDEQQFAVDFDRYKRSQTGAKIGFKRPSLY